MGTLVSAACACCGTKELVCEHGADDQNPTWSSAEFRWTRFDVADASCLQLSDDEKEQWDSNIYKHCKSVHRSKDPLGLYYLIPSLVSDQSFAACSNCSAALKINKRPAYSVAKGMDYGDLSSLPKLSFLERLLISKTVIHLTKLKLKQRSADSREDESETQFAIKGHTIAFPHNSIEVLTDILPRSTTSDLLQVKWFGKPNQLAQFKAHTRGLHMLAVRKSAIVQWLHFLKAVNPHYASVVIDQKVLDLSEEEYSNRIIGDLEDHATLESSNTMIGVDQAAEDQHSTNFNGKTDEGDHIQSIMLASTDGGLARENLSMDDVFKALDSSLTVKKDDCEDENSDDDLVDQDEATAHTVPSVADPAVKEATNQAWDEYTQNDIMHYESFPTLFPFGTGLTSKTPVSLMDSRRMLLYHDQRFATNHSFIFHLFNQRMRHENSAGTSIYVKNTPSSIITIASIVLDPTFDAKIKLMKRNPAGKEAKKLLQEMSQHLKWSGKKVPFTSTERHMSLAHLIAYCRHFGPPTWFITISPSDMDSALIVQHASASTKTIVEMPQLKERMRIMTENPVACVEVFYRTIQNVMIDLIGKISSFASILINLGMKPDHMIKKSHDDVAKRLRGIFGVPIAYYGVIEAQGRGTLHIHFCLWGGIPPQTLQKICHDKDLAKLGTNYFDRTVSAKLPLSIHILDAERRLKHEPAVRSGMKAINNGDGLSFQPWLEAIRQKGIVLQNHTTHHPTCFKGKQGKYKCRMGFPRSTVDCNGNSREKTCFLQLIDNPDDPSCQTLTDTMTIDQFVEVFDDGEPFCTADDRIILLDLARPDIGPESIPAHLLMNLDHTHVGLSNGNIVEFSPALTNAVNCNTCCSPLGKL